MRTTAVVVGNTTAHGRTVKAQCFWYVNPEKSSEGGQSGFAWTWYKTTWNLSCMVIANHWKISKPETDIRFLFKDGCLHRCKDS